MPKDKRFREPTTQRKLCRDYFESMVALDQLIEHDQVHYLASLLECHLVLYLHCKASLIDKYICMVSRTVLHTATDIQLAV